MYYMYIYFVYIITYVCRNLWKIKTLSKYSLAVFFLFHIVTGAAWTVTRKIGVPAQDNHIKKINLSMTS